jgi:hypothetical protein
MADKKKVRGKKKLVLVPGKVPQLRKASNRSWNRRKADHFLLVVAETCNVSEACRRSGLPMTVAYRRRKSDAAFRAAWVEAIAIAYQRLEAVLLDRFFNGTEKVTIRRDGSEERMREFPNHLGLQLLKMHRETAMEADSDMPEEDADEIRERLVRKLQRLKKRDEEKEARASQLRGGDGSPDGAAEGGKPGAPAPRDAGDERRGAPEV